MMQTAQPQQIPTAAVLQQYNPNVKDSRWLTLEVCREFTRSKCSRSELECKFAHPPPHVEVQQGRVTCCFDSIKGKCQRKDPPCKYLHPPQHLREQLLQNGRNNLILKNIYQMQLMSHMYSPVQAANAHPYLVPGSANTGAFINPASYTPSNIPGLSNNTLMQAIDPTNGSATALGQVSMPTIIPTQSPSIQATAKMSRPDRLEVCREFQRGTCTRQPSECRYSHPPENVTIDSVDNFVTVCMDFIKGKCARETCRYFHPPTHLQAQIKAAQQRANAATVPPSLGMGGVAGGMVQVPMKRPAVDKSGIPMYQPNSLASQNAQYQTLAAMQLAQQQQFVPVTNGNVQYTYGNMPYTFAGHPASLPRF